MINVISCAVILVTLLMLSFWGIYCWRKNPGVIDVAWALAIGISGICYSRLYIYHAAQSVYIGLLVVWMLRLSGYLLLTRIIPGEVDKRYVNLSEGWKMKKSLGFLLNYLFQGFLALWIALPFLFLSQVSISFFWTLGLLLILTGLLGEVIADHQLQTFKKSNPKQVCNIGLWRFSRHPNYFFEWCIWLGFAVACLSEPWGWMALISPALLLGLMLKVTGPITEQSSMRSRGQAYVDYQKKTPMFFPRLWINT